MHAIDENLMEMKFQPEYCSGKDLPDRSPWLWT